MTCSERPVLVTGASGFTGGRLAIALSRAGNRVRAMCRDGAKTDHLVKHGVEISTGELVCQSDVRRAARDTRLIYHIAAAYRSAKYPDAYYQEVNVGGTKNVLDAAISEGVERLVHCSTVGVHGHVESIPADETAPMAPADVYQESKADAEVLVQDAIGSGLPGVVVRPAGIYGPGDTRFLKLFRAIHHQTFRMIGDGSALYQMIYIDDLVTGIILCGTHPAAIGEVFILTGREYVAIRDIASLVAAAVGRQEPRGTIPLAPVMAAARVCEMVCRPLGIEPPLHRRRLDFFTKDRAFSVGKAQQQLGFRCQVELADGLRRTARWYRQEGWL